MLCYVLSTFDTECRTLRIEEMFRVDSCLFHYSSDSAFRQITRMIRNGRSRFSGGMSPDLVTASRTSIELESKAFELPSNVSITESGEPTH